MRLMGTDRLHAIATGADSALATAAACLHAELVAAKWSTPADAAANFPKAVTRGSRLCIPLNDLHHVVLLVDYRLATVLVESAGPIEGDVPRPKKTRKSA